MNIPRHVAIIMDGNGRWGLLKAKSRNYGHKEGINTVKNIIEGSIEKKIKYLTLYTFSTENWKRPKFEINFLFNLLSNFIDEELDNLNKKKIKIRILGNINKFPKKLKNKLNLAQKITSKNSLIQINVALNYGSRQEIIHTIKKINLQKKKITEKIISKNLFTSKIPDPDILIRTGNRARLSNFLLWQLQYTEIFFEKKLWPDFKKNDFFRILNQFSKIKRNYGDIR